MTEPGRRPVRLFAPAKVNLGLEITGKRPDGYHDVVTVLESISIFDVVQILPATSTRVVTTTGVPERENLVSRAIAEVERSCRVSLNYQFRIDKGIPEAAGLGGGSSDAGTVLAWLQEVHQLDHGTVRSVAGSLGSDVPFFLRGGTALARGTGTDLTPIANPGRRWYVILTPDLEIQGKTGALYRQIDATDFTDGSDTFRVRDRIQAGWEAQSLPLRNVFQRPLLEYPAVRRAVEALHEAGASIVLPSGAGPAVFAICDSCQEAALLARRVHAAAGRVRIATSVRYPVNPR